MVRQQRVSEMSEDRFPLCQSHGSGEHRGKFKGNRHTDTKERYCEKGKVRDKDELVKHMLNPPRYLQRKEKTENFRGKALSFGVLDWERLESWKQFAEGTGRVVTSSDETAFTSMSSISENSRGCGEEKHFDSCSGASSSHKAERFQDYESACRGKLEEKKWINWNADSIDRGYSDLSASLVNKLELDQKIGSGVGSLCPSMRYQNVSFRSREYAKAMDAGSGKRTKEGVKVDVNKKMPVNSSVEDVYSSVQQNMSFRIKGRKKNETTNLDLSHQPRLEKPANIVLLRPNKYSLNSHMEKHQACSGKNLAEKMDSDVSREFLIREDHSYELRSTIPQSCPLLFSHQTNPGSETSFQLLAEASKKDECLDNRRDVEGECSQRIDAKDRNRKGDGNPCLLDQEMLEVSSRKGRHTSPNRDFSFSFRQMGRSFSFKEGSSVPMSSSPPYISTKSGPLRSDGSVYRNSSSTHTKQNGHNRTKSSPLRRIIDPLLKPKTENRVSTQAATVCSNPRLTVNKSPEKEKKHGGSTVRALLQFTERKEVHLFQFVVDNNDNSVLAATMKSSDSSSRFYTFYSVKKVKKKTGGWLGQGSKEKSQGFSYTLLGHMRTTTDFTSQKSESILLDIDKKVEDQPVANAELAAIVGDCHSSTVILPGGVHTLPKGSDALSPLIERWRSEGTCDCGGWDIGCKLRILSEKRSHSDKANSFEFFDQESDKPTLTMVSLGDGLHSVEFDSTVSLLLAFFISLTTSIHEEPLGIRDGNVKLREQPMKYASNPPVSPVGRV